MFNSRHIFSAYRVTAYLFCLYFFFRVFTEHEYAIFFRLASLTLTWGELSRSFVHYLIKVVLDGYQNSLGKLNHLIRRTVSWGSINILSCQLRVFLSSERKGLLTAHS